jgi:hypothetical protein
VSVRPRGLSVAAAKRLVDEGLVPASAIPDNAWPEDIRAERASVRREHEQHDRTFAAVARSVEMTNANIAQLEARAARREAKALVDTAIAEGRLEREQRETVLKPHASDAEVDSRL